MAILERREDSVQFASSDAPEARFSPAEYDRLLVERKESYRIELVRGKLITQPVQYILHGLAIRALVVAFATTLPQSMEALSGVTCRMGENRLEPDLAVVRLDSEGLQRMVESDEVLLAVEVSVTTLAYDRDEKTIYYAESGIPEYWIVNPVAQQIEVYRRPVGGRYQDVYLILPGESLSALCLPDIDFAAESLMPKK